MAKNNNDKPTVDLNIRGLDEDLYHRLDSLKRKRFGGRKSWGVFFNWLLNNQSMWETMVDAVKQALKEEEEKEVKE